MSTNKQEGENLLGEDDRQRMLASNVNKEIKRKRSSQADISVSGPLSQKPVEDEKTKKARELEDRRKVMKMKHPNEYIPRDLYAIPEEADKQEEVKSKKEHFFDLLVGIGILAMLFIVTVLMFLFNALIVASFNEMLVAQIVQQMVYVVIPYIVNKYIWKIDWAVMYIKELRLVMTQVFAGLQEKKRVFGFLYALGSCITGWRMHAQPL